MKGSRKNQYGVTLIEVVVVLAVLATVIAALNRPLSRLIQTRTDINATSTREEDINFAMARMATEIRFSTESESVENCGEDLLTIGGTTYETSQSGDLVFSNDVLLVKNIDSFSCSIESAELRLYQITVKVPDRSAYSVHAFKRAP